jgi:hypothetical protein
MTMQAERHRDGHYEGCPVSTGDETCTCGPLSWRDQQIAARVASGANSTPESAAWSVDYGAGYSRGQADARDLLYRPPSGNEAWSAGYERGYAWARGHMPAVPGPQFTQAELIALSRLLCDATGRLQAVACGDDGWRWMQPGHAAAAAEVRALRDAVTLAGPRGPQPASVLFAGEVATP